MEELLKKAQSSSSTEPSSALARFSMPSTRRTTATRARETVWVNRFDTDMGPVTLASTAKGVVACSLPGKSKGHVLDWLAPAEGADA